MRTTVRFILTLFLLSLTVTSAMATVICLQNGQVNATGNTAALHLVMDSAPSGLSGYALTLTLTDPSVATITSVSFPAWATMKSNTELPSSSTKLKAIDMGEQVTPGATSIPFGTIYVTGRKTGTTRILINSIMLTDDAGFPIDSAVREGVFTAGAPYLPSFASGSDCAFGPTLLAGRYGDRSMESIFAWNRGSGTEIFSTFKNPILR